MSKYDIHMTLTTSSVIDPQQIIGEALENYKEAMKIDELGELITGCEGVG